MSKVKKITITIEETEDGKIKNGFEVIGMNAFEAMGALRYHEKKYGYK